MSSLDFAHTKFARLLPAARAVLFFACGVPRVVFDYSSRIGSTQSWHATFDLLKRLAKQDSEYIREHANDLLKWLILRFDNVQQYHKQRERRIGRENTMKVGIAATVAEAHDFVPEAADLDDHLSRISAGRRRDLTVEKLTDMVDWDHAEVVAELQWLQALVNHIPSLASLKHKVAELYQTDGAKLIVPVRKTKIHALPTAAKNEAVSTELRDGLVDFLKSIGQTEDCYVRRLIPVGGDGLTFEKLVQLKNQLQFQKTEFQRFDIIWPFLEIWHTIWTYLSAVFETHFGDPLTLDPSTLGHSATQIDQKAPPNLKKVDYYSSLYVALTILDARMLDCWRFVTIILLSIETYVNTFIGIDCTLNVKISLCTSRLSRHKIGYQPSMSCVWLPVIYTSYTRVSQHTMMLWKVGMQPSMRGGLQDLHGVLMTMMMTEDGNGMGLEPRSRLARIMALTVEMRFLWQLRSHL